ncbi:MAG TPA: hypothetical protein VFK86_21575 [Bauldia sp.]|nr:hypothetical protein [Bauldia sp.]
MIRPLAALLPVFLLISGASAETAPDTRLAAFEAACLEEHRDPDARRAVIRAAGWTPVPDQADSSLARLMEISRQTLVTAKQEEGVSGAIAAYGQRFAGRDLYLVTTELDMPAEAAWKIDLLGCYLYDFAATTPLDPAIVSRRFDEKPAEVVDEPGVIVAQIWNIEQIEGVWELRNTFIPPGSPAAAVTGFTGLAISLTSTKKG